MREVRGACASHAARSGTGGRSRAHRRSRVARDRAGDRRRRDQHHEQGEDREAPPPAAVGPVGDAHPAHARPAVGNSAIWRGGARTRARSPSAAAMALGAPPGQVDPRRGAGLDEAEQLVAVGRVAPGHAVCGAGRGHRLGIDRRARDQRDPRRAAPASAASSRARSRTSQTSAPARGGPRRTDGAARPAASRRRVGVVDRAVGADREPGGRGRRRDVEALRRRRHQRDRERAGGGRLAREVEPRPRRPRPGPGTGRRARRTARRPPGCRTTRSSAGSARPAPPPGHTAPA